jgi:hypothetical protein
MDEMLRQAAGHGQSRTLLAALAVAAALLTGCGSGGDDTSSISEADLKEAVRDARQEERLKALQDEVEDLRDEESTGPPASPGAPTTTEPGEFAYTSYTDSLGGWTAEVPTGGGWSAPSASEQNPALFSTRMQGPNGLFVVVHTTPSDTPAFSGAPIDSRTTVTAPNFGTATKIVFQGNSNFPECEGGLCVDYLIPSGAGGYAILAGGGGDIGAAEEVAAHMLETLQG